MCVHTPQWIAQFDGVDRCRVDCVVILAISGVAHLNHGRLKRLILQITLHSLLITVANFYPFTNEKSPATYAEIAHDADVGAHSLSL